MVIEAYSPKPQDNSSANGRASDPISRARVKMAAPLDRLAAASVDWLVVQTPVFVALSSPVKRQMVEALVLDERSEFTVAVALMVVCALVLAWLYQSLMTYFFGGTLGKLLFGLRVVDVWSHQRPRLGACMVRGLAYLFDTFALCVPHLSVFSNIRRRPLHDKLADTIVITLYRAAAASPQSPESSFVRGVYAGVVAIAAVTLGVIGFQIVDELRDQDQVAKIFGGEGAESEQCDAVSQALDRGQNRTTAQVEDRLQTAMAMFAAGLVGRECLRVEVEDVLHRQGSESAIAYLAQAFVHADQAELSNAYLEQACKLEPNSESCHMTSVIDSWTNDNFADVEKALTSMPEETSLFVNVWRIRYFVKLGHYGDALRFIDQLSTQSALAPFLDVQRVKSLWGQHHRSEARLLASSLLESLDPAQQADLAGWMCYEELSQNCRAATAVSCQSLSRQLSETDEIRDLTSVALADLLMQDQCGGVEPAKLSKWTADQSSEPIKKLATAFRLHAENNLTEARKALQAIVDDDSNPDSVHEEALRRMVSWASDGTELAEMRELWSKLDGVKRSTVGHHLIRRYLTLGNFKGAITLADELGADARDDAEMARDLVLAAFKTGNKDRAYGWLRTYHDLVDSSVSARSPAAVDEFSRVSRLLEKEFGR